MFEDLPTLNASKHKPPHIHGRVADPSHLFCSCFGRPDILVVDDNVFNIMTLQTILETSMKVKSDKALNGRIAVELIQRRIEDEAREPCTCKRKRANYKLVFMDCNMPVMDGFQATKEIRSLLGDEKIHIVALTAYTSEAFEKKCLNIGMDSFLTKPISDTKIHKLLK